MLTSVTKGKTLVIEGKSSHASEKKLTFWAKPNKLPAGPREKRPIGRLFSSSVNFSKGPQESIVESLIDNIESILKEYMARAMWAIYISLPKNCL